MKRGFTLIELLVVIAIIGILASIVLVAMGGARDAARDAAVKSELSQVRSLAEIYLTNNGTYTGFDLTGIDLTEPCGDYDVVVEIGVGIEGTTYAAYGPLCSTGADFWCVDSAGASKAAIANTTALCP